MNRLEKTRFTFYPIILTVPAIALLQIGWAFQVHAAEETPVPAVVSPEETSAQPKSSASSSSSHNGLRVDGIVITGTWTPHEQKDSPVEIERITGKMLEQAGATNVRQVLQDVPAIELRRSAGNSKLFKFRVSTASTPCFWSMDRNLSVR